MILGSVHQPVTGEAWLGGRDLPTTLGGAPLRPLEDLPLAEALGPGDEHVRPGQHPGGLGADELRGQLGERPASADEPAPEQRATVASTEVPIASFSDAVIEPYFRVTARSSQSPSQHQDRRFMPDLSSFPITQRWPASHPDRLQLYAAPTPNGVKVSIMLEETGLAYEPHLIDISNNESKDPAFVSLNPNGRIPAIIDPAGPDGRPIALWESGAILLYLADKTGQFISTEPGQRYETLAWVFFQMSAIGPMFGQLGFFLRFGFCINPDNRFCVRFSQVNPIFCKIYFNAIYGRHLFILILFFHFG